MGSRKVRGDSWFSRPEGNQRPASDSIDGRTALTNVTYWLASPVRKRRAMRGVMAWAC